MHCTVLYTLRPTCQLCLRHVLGRIECMKCGLLRSMITGVCQSVTRLRCANTAARIEVLLGVKTLGDPTNIVWDESFDSPKNSMRSSPNYFDLWLLMSTFTRDMQNPWHEISHTVLLYITDLQNETYDTGHRIGMYTSR